LNALISQSVAQRVTEKWGQLQGLELGQDRIVAERAGLDVARLQQPQEPADAGAARLGDMAQRPLLHPFQNRAAQSGRLLAQFPCGFGILQLVQAAARPADTP
jgi:hypothetical protein